MHLKQKQPLAWGQWGVLHCPELSMPWPALFQRDTQGTVVHSGARWHTVARTKKDLKFQVSLDYVMEPCLKQQQQQ